MKGYFLSTRAAKDLREIKEYLVREAGWSATRREMAKINQRFRVISRNPAMGHSRHDLTLKPLRFYPVSSYVIVYLEKKPIEIVRVFHGGQDIEAILTQP